MSPCAMYTKKSAKFLLLVTFVLVAAQYLFNALMVTRKPVSLQSFIDMYKNGSLVNIQRGVAANFSQQEVTEAVRLEPCPIIPPSLKGHVTVNTQIPSWAYLEEEHAGLEPGGRYRPRDCVARSRVAIIIPFRDREIHLKIFLQNIHPFLQRQQLDYGIYVVEIAPDVKFNRALLMNVGFVEALKQYDFQCFIFHDVDLLPEDDRNLYTCPQTPRHMSVAIDRLQYKLPYTQIFGGVSAITKDHFRRINGFSNLYFGWGGEDDDMYRRILYSNLTVTRYSPKVARYKMLVHKKDAGNPQRFQLLRDMRRRYLSDGLSSLNYTIIQTELKRLFTWILIRVDEKEVLRPFIVPKKPLATLPAKKPPPPPPIFPEANNPNRPPVNSNIVPAQQKLPGAKKIPPPPLLGQPVRVVLQKAPASPTKRKLFPQSVDWVPRDFKGKLPDYLNNYDFAEKQEKLMLAKQIMNKAINKKVNDGNKNSKRDKVANAIKAPSAQQSQNNVKNNVNVRKMPIPKPPAVNSLDELLANDVHGNSVEGPHYPKTVIVHEKDVLKRVVNIRGDSANGKDTKYNVMPGQSGIAKPLNNAVEGGEQPIPRPP